MKTLIWKELRENLKVGVFAFLLAVVLVVSTQLYYLDMIEAVSAGTANVSNYVHRLQPLTSDNFRVFCMTLCCLCGMALGWSQIHTERHRDLWAFLVHRPMSRTKILLSKVAAGMILYATAVGLPLLYLVWWEVTPGNVAAPFDWGMTSFVVVAFISGTGWYFAGMLTSIRQTRWLGSRALGIGAAGMTTFFMFGPHSGALAALLIAALGVAAWGAFQTGGAFRGQPIAGKIGLTLALTAGCAVIAICAVVLGFEVTADSRNHPAWSEYYQMGNDGNVYLVRLEGQLEKIFSLDRKAVNDPDTGRPIDPTKFEQKSEAAGMYASVTQPMHSLFEVAKWFDFVAPSHDTVWYRVPRTGRIEAYNVQTRKFMGSLGPDGWSKSHTGDGSRFIDNHGAEAYLSEANRNMFVMVSKEALYLVSLESQTVRSLWTVAKDETISSYGNFVMNGQLTVLTPKEALLFHISFQSAELVWRLPRSVSQVQVFELNNGPGPAYCVWVDDYSSPAKKAVWLSKEGAITKELSLPELKASVFRGWRTTEALTPAGIFLTTPFFGDNLQRIDWQKVSVSAAVGLPGMLIGLWLGRRYSFSAKRQLVWAGFNLLFGIPGFLGFIAVQEWPARERCPHCGKLRVVDADQCEHCGSTFEAPKQNGTEIFEALEMVDQRA